MFTPFRIVNRLDGNLFPCVRKMRRNFANGSIDTNEDPSVLEIIASLAIECEDYIMRNEEFGDRTTEWFWKMLYNLGVNVYDDEHYTPAIAEDISDKVDVFLDRTYDYYGEGNIFVCNNPHYDMRNAPLWEQLNWELNEEYSDEFRVGW